MQLFFLLFMLFPLAQANQTPVSANKNYLIDLSGIDLPDKGCAEIELSLQAAPANFYDCMLHNPRSACWDFLEDYNRCRKMADGYRNMGFFERFFLQLKDGAVFAETRCSLVGALRAQMKDDLAHNTYTDKYTREITSLQSAIAHLRYPENGSVLQNLPWWISFKITHFLFFPYDNVFMYVVQIIGGVILGVILCVVGALLIIGLTIGIIFTFLKVRALVEKIFTGVRVLIKKVSTKCAVFRKEKFCRERKNLEDVLTILNEKKSKDDSHVQ